jgi:hypothetical protein
MSTSDLLKCNFTAISTFLTSFGSLCAVPCIYIACGDRGDVRGGGGHKFETGDVYNKREEIEKEHLWTGDRRIHPPRLFSNSCIQIVNISVPTVSCAKKTTPYQTKIIFQIAQF